MRRTKQDLFFIEYKKNFINNLKLFEETKCWPDSSVVGYTQPTFTCDQYAHHVVMGCF